MSRDFDPLEKIVSKELSKLAPLKAPPVLAESVLARVQATPGPAWWQQSIWSWPPLARVVFLFVAVALLLTVCGGSWVASPEVHASWEAAGQKLNGFSVLGSALVALGTWLAALWQHSIHPWLPYIMATAAFAYVLCLALGTAVARYAFRSS